MRPGTRRTRTLLVCTASLAALAYATASEAADLPIFRKAAPVAVAAPSWTGFYIGGAIGSGMVVHDVGVAIGGGNFGFDGIGGGGWLGSVYAGFDYQIGPRVVLGIMADGSWSNIETTLDVTGGGLAADASVRADASWSVLGRVGVLSDSSTLWYILGGYTWQNFHSKLNVPGVITALRNDDANGWTVGVGVETTFFWPGWFTKVEYRYTHFENTTFLGGALGIQPDMHTVRSGLSYKFGGFGAPAPALPQLPVNWTGFYVGVAGGWGAVLHDVNVALGGVNVDLDGVGGQGLLGSVYGGFDFQFGQFVFGVMADGTWSNIETTLNATLGGGALNASVRADTAWSALARVGYLSSPATLWYWGAGYTWQNFHSRINIPGVVSASRNDDVNGLTLASGVETMLTSNWGVRLEYRYTWFEDTDFFGGALSIKPQMHTVRAGLNYKFNWGAPVVASY